MISEKFLLVIVQCTRNNIHIWFLNVLYLRKPCDLGISNQFIFKMPSGTEEDFP